MTTLHEVRLYLVDLTPIDAAGHRGKATAPFILVEMP